MGARLGQHFLFDPRILGRIADAAELGPRDTVLEIGPGKGTLTRQLATRAGRVIAIEADRKLAAELEQAFAGSTVQIVAGDALRVPWPPADVVCGNIPYQITSPLIEHALTPPRPRRIVFLMQREVAERLTAEPGTEAYGALSAGVQLVADVALLFGVKAGAFRPPPRVESAVVRIVPKPPQLQPDEDDHEAARRLIRAAFQRRRQQLQRTLREAWDVDSEVAANLLSAMGLPTTVRGEMLSAQQFLSLARSLPRV